MGVFDLCIVDRHACPVYRSFPEGNELHFRPIKDNSSLPPFHLQCIVFMCYCNMTLLRKRISAVDDIKEAVCPFSN